MNDQSTSTRAREVYTALHKAAMKASKDHYIDPETGATVFTALFHQKRGECCGSKCRHCPYNHVNVPEDQK